MIPANIMGDGIIESVKSGRDYAVKANFSTLSEQTALAAPDNFLAVVQNKSDKSFSKIQMNNLPVDWTKIQNKPSTFPPSAHTHPYAEILAGSASLTAIGALSPTTNTIPVFTGASSASLNAVTSFTLGFLSRTDAAGALSYLGVGKDTFNTRAEFVAASIAGAVNTVTLNGYAAYGDGGAAKYFRITAPSPVKAWHVQSADGAWWELRADPVTPKQLGAKGDGATDDTTAAQNAADYAAAFTVDCAYTKGIYIIPSQTITLANDVRITGRATIRRTTDKDAPLFLASGTSDVHIAGKLILDNSINTSSTTSNSVSVASKTFTTQAERDFTVGGSVMLISNASPSNYMIGTLTSYSSTTMVVNVTTAIGSGTYTDWIIVRNSGLNSAIRFLNSTRSLADGIRLTGRWYVGVVSENGKTDIIRNSTSSGVINRPFYMYATSGTSDDCRIIYCSVSGGGLTQYGVNLNGSTSGSITNYMVHGCEVEETTFQAFEAGGAATDGSFSQIKAKNLGASATGLLIQRANSLTAQRAVVSGVQMLNAGATAIDVIDSFYISITSGTITGSPIGANFRQVNATTTCQYIAVAALVISGATTFSMNFEAANANALSNISVSNNVLVGTGGGSVGVRSTANTASIAYVGNVASNHGTNYTTLGTGHISAGNI